MYAVPTILLAKEGFEPEIIAERTIMPGARLNACPWPVRRHTLASTEATLAKRETKVSDPCAEPERQLLQGHVSWARAHYRLCRCNHKASAWKMHANLADLTIAASDHDLMDIRGDQFTDNRVASSIVRRDGN